MITMKQLGRMGRWGNQIFQYAFLRTYAKKLGLSYQCPQWEGQRIFGFDDPPLNGASLPQLSERWNIDHSSRSNYQDAWYPSIPPTGRDAINKDYCGYCQFHTSYYAPFKQFLQNTFTIAPEVERRVLPILEKLRYRGKTLVGLHLRRGDTGRAIFYLTPNQWYLKWLEENWDRLDNPALFIASEDPKDIEDFRRYRPSCTSDFINLKAERYTSYNYLRCDLDNPLPASMDWFPDWYVLNHCDVLLFGESTFSFTAALLNPSLREAWRSRLSLQSFEKINPWNTEPLAREHLDDHPNIPGTAYKDNPKWVGGEVPPE